MKKKKITKSMTAMLLLFVIAGACIGTSLAVITDKADVVQNTMIPGEVTTAVKETFNGTTKNNVQIKNTGNTDAYIRAAVFVTWQKVEGDKVLVYGEAPKAGDYTIDWNVDTIESKEDNENPWLEGSDGFYYHKAPVAPCMCTGDKHEGCMTGVLIKTCTFDSKPEGIPSDYNLCVEIIASGIQAKGFADDGDTPVVVKEWGVTLDGDNIAGKN